MDQQTTPIHPTRSAPLCAACAHFLIDIYKDQGVCNHPSTPRHPVTGEAVAPVKLMRGRFRDLSLNDLESGHCGPSAVLFQPQRSAAEAAAQQPTADVLQPGANLTEPTADVVAQHLCQPVSSAGAQEGRHQLGVGLGEAGAELPID